MAFLLNQQRICIQPRDKARLCGSNRFTFENGELKENKREKKDTPFRLEYSESYEKAQRMNAAFELINRRNNEEFTKKDGKYKLNVKKVRSRAYALFNTNQGNKFMSFISLSFPCGFSDDDAFKCFNIWLTRCRKDVGLKHYIWVAERQDNGTIHFHIITTHFLDIKTINRFMAVSLSKYYDKYSDNETFAKYTSKEEFLVKYNGVDIEKVKARSVDKNKQKLAYYISKYVSKDNVAEFDRLTWHCSRSVSSLFTDMNISEDEACSIIETMKQMSFNPTEFVVNDFVSVVYLNIKNENESAKDWFNLPDHFTEELKEHNSKILKAFANGEYK